MLKPRPLLARGTVVEGYNTNRHLKTLQYPPTTPGVEISERDTTNPPINQPVSHR